jgi:hypothetical protein
MDDKLWPLLVVQFSGPQSDWEFEQYLDALSERVNRREPYVCVVDARLGDAASPEQRHRKAEWLKLHEPLLREHCLGTAFVLTSPVVRLSLQVILALRPLVIPHTTVSTLEAGVGWAAERLQAAGHAFEALRVRGAYGLFRTQRSG